MPALACRAIPALGALALGLTLAAPAAATPSGRYDAAVRRLDPGSLVLLPTAAGDCAGGLVYDDGSYESRVSLAGQSSFDAVMPFDLPFVPAQLREVCLCWTRTGGSAAASVDLLIYRADGPGGAPGQIETGLAGVALANVPLAPATATYRLDLTQLGIDLAAERFYIGASWDSEEQPELHACGDDNGGATRQLFYSTDQGAAWNDLAALFPDLDALGVRAKVAAGDGFTCTPDDTTLCLNHGRFQVRLNWRTRQGDTGAGHVVPFGSDDSGLLYFFSASNWEMLLKALDGCAVNGHYWVFFAAVTNVEFTLTVTDSQTGQAKVYNNPLGNTAQTVTDTNAFACQ